MLGTPQKSLSQRKHKTAHRFKPGQSGNPKGRPPRTPDEFNLMLACKEKTPQAVLRITQLMEKADKDSVCLNAAMFIVERAYGKAVQPTEDRSPLANAATDVLLAMKDALEARKAKQLNAP